MLSIYYCMPGPALRALYGMSHFILRINGYGVTTIIIITFFWEIKVLGQRLNHYPSLYRNEEDEERGFEPRHSGSGALHQEFTWLSDWMGSLVWWFRASQVSLPLGICFLICEEGKYSGLPDFLLRLLRRPNIKSTLKEKKRNLKTNPIQPCVYF